MDKEVKFRHEMKYLVTDAQILMLENRLKHLIPKDPHVNKDGIYVIRSLYFDDYDDRCLQENESGTDPREKFRIRIYNGSADRIRLECKRKERGKTLKTSCPLSREQTEELMAGRYLRDIADQPAVLRKLTLQMMQRRMRPKVIVEYERIPYIYKEGNVRITFDTHLSSSQSIGDFLRPEIKKRPVMPIGQQLLEVKYDEYLPDFIYRNLQIDSLWQTAYSKYYLCRRYNYHGMSLL